jgi:hypothetical protein
MLFELCRLASAPFMKLSAAFARAITSARIGFAVPGAGEPHVFRVGSKMIPAYAGSASPKTRQRRNDCLTIENILTCKKANECAVTRWQCLRSTILQNGKRASPTYQHSTFRCPRDRPYGLSIAGSTILSGVVTRVSYCGDWSGRSFGNLLVR